MLSEPKARPRTLLLLAAPAALLAAACTGSAERSCGLTAGDESACGEDQVCVCAVSRCARFDTTCSTQFRYAAGSCVEEAFALTTRPSTPENHPACSAGHDADAADGGDDADDADDAAETRDDAATDALICLNALDCTDDNVCNGIEDCNPETRTCIDGPPPDDGSPCTSPLPGRCRGGLCLAYECGDGVMDAFRGEECDDGNDVVGDGCEPDCRTTCLEGDPCHEAPDDVCTVDACTLLEPPDLGRLCTHEAAPPTEACDYRDTDCDTEVDEGMTRGLLSGPLRFTDTPEPSRGAVLAWNTSNYLVAWTESPAAVGGLWAGRITDSGAPMGAAHRVDAAGSARSPALLWSPSAWAVAWLDERRGSGTVDARLAVLDTAAVRIGAEQALSTAAARADGTPALAWDGTGLAVAWSDQRLGPADSEIWFAHAGPDAVPDAAGELRVTAAAGLSREPALAWTGSVYLLAWIDGRDAAASGEEQLWLLSLGAAGAPTAAPVALTTAARSPRDLRTAWNGSQLALAWTDARTGTDQLYWRLVDAAGTGAAEQPLTAGVEGAAMPALAWSGLEWDVAWSAPTPGGSDVIAAWYPPPGTPKEGEYVVDSAPGAASFPSLVWNGAGTAVAWTDDRDGNHEVYFAILGCAP